MNRSTQTAVSITSTIAATMAAMLSGKPTKLNRDEVLAWYNGRSHFADAHAAEPDAQLIAPLLLEDWW